MQRSHHPQIEENSYPSNDRDMKSDYFGPLEPKKFNYTKVDFFHLNRPSRESRDSEQQTFSYTQSVFVDRKCFFLGPIGILSIL